MLLIISPLIRASLPLSLESLKISEIFFFYRETVLWGWGQARAKWRVICSSDHTLIKVWLLEVADIESCFDNRNLTTCYWKVKVVRPPVCIIFKSNLLKRIYCHKLYFSVVTLNSCACVIFIKLASGKFYHWMFYYLTFQFYCWCASRKACNFE